MKVLVTGATGFVGQRVVRKLLDIGNEVVALTRDLAKGARRLDKNCKLYQWADTSTLPPEESFQGVEGIIHLLGEGIADKRWNEEQKKRLYDSRIISTFKIIERIKGLEQKPSVLVSASAIGIYGNRGDEDITEESTLANDFLGKLCQDWESEAMKAQDLGLRVAIIRTGVVLGKNGGAIKKMLLPFKMGLGGPVGSGTQYMSWIHLDDLAEMYLYALKHPSVKGVYNGTAPYPVTSKEFAMFLGKSLHRPAIFPVPAFMLKAIFGEMSQVLLEGQKVLPTKFQKEEFRFQYPVLEQALRFL